MHEPNYNAVLYLKETIWPLNKKAVTKSRNDISMVLMRQKKQQQLNKPEARFYNKRFCR